MLINLFSFVSTGQRIDSARTGNLSETTRGLIHADSLTYRINKTVNSMQILLSWSKETSTVAASEIGINFIVVDGRVYLVLAFVVCGGISEESVRAFVQRRNE